MLDTNTEATISDLRLVLGRHSLLLPLFVLALLSLPLTIIPFTSAILGIPMTVLAVQLAMGRNTIWLPQAWLQITPPTKYLHYIYPKLIWLFERLESMTRARYHQFSEAPLHHLSGFLFVALSLAIALPIPFGNVAPAIAVLCLALGHMEQDGGVIAIGQCIGLLTLGALLVIVTLVIGAFGAVNLLTGS